MQNSHRILAVKTDFKEIDEGTGYIGYQEAFDIIGNNVRPLGEEVLFLDLCAGRVVAADLVAQVSYPSIDVSLKDGFAVKSTDVVFAKRSSPVCLKVAGSAFAGVKYEGYVENGRAVEICSGASIPDGADAVVAGEFCEEMSVSYTHLRAHETGRNLVCRLLLEKK